MKCPVCKDVNLTMSERQGIEIDYCPECRGVWLDRGELDKLIERNESARAEPPPRDFKRGGYEDSHRHHHRKPKSLLRELFD